MAQRITNPVGGLLGWAQRKWQRLRLLPWKSIGGRVGRVGVWVLAIPVVPYLWGMIYYNGPFAQAGVGNVLLGLMWIGVSISMYQCACGWKKRLLALVIAVLLVLIPWSYIRPSNDRDWSPEFKMTGYTEVTGDRVTMHHFRNFDYPRDASGPGGGVVERWETRTVHLSNLRGLDYFQSNFKGDLLAHPLLSFDFGTDGRVCLSVETRREVGEAFTPFGGLYKMFELQYLFVSEEDCIRLRTNVRKETVRLYSISAPLDEVRDMFLRAVEIQNRLAEKPRFYNVIHANCTTSLRDQRPEHKRGAWDRRILLNGMLDEYLYERGRIANASLPFQELRARCQINDAAAQAHDDPDFSERIRVGRPGR